MLGNFILETTNAPGTSADCLLAGPASGRLPFSFWFASGSQCFYILNDSTQQEWGIGTYTSGSPNKLTRTTVLKNSAGTTARLNFLGATRIYNDLPAERTLYTDNAGNINVGGVVFAASFQASGTGGAAAYKLYDPSAAVDAKFFDFMTSAGGLYGRAVNDLYSTANSWLTVTRSGYTITGITLAGTNIVLNGAVALNSTLTVPGAVTLSSTLNVTGIATVGDFYSLGAIRLSSSGGYFFSDTNYTYLNFDSGGWRWQYTRSSGALTYVRGYDGVGLLTIDPGGNVNAPGSGSFSGNVNAGANVSAPNGTVIGANIMSNSGTFYIGGNFAYYLGRNPSNGAWSFVENGVPNMTIDAAGNLAIRSTFDATGWVRGRTGVYANTDNTLGMFQSGNYRYMQYAANWFWYWDGTNGDLIWNLDNSAGTGGPFIQFRSSDRNLINNKAGMLAYGPYVNVSDERLKTDIVPASHGLDEILAIQPIVYRRLDEKGEPTERSLLGFSAQQLSSVLPEAVTPVGTAHKEGPGSLASDDPILGVALDPIVAALVNGMRSQAEQIASLTARLAALEAGKEASP
jgi:endosialidase-like protein